MTPQSNDVTLSVIIPVFNDALGITKCLSALERQTLAAENYEVLVVDNGSTDHIDVVVAQNVTLLFEPDPGSYRARNRALQHARGRILALTDADCIPAPDWLERATRHFDTDTTIDMIGGKVEIFPIDHRNRTPVELYEQQHAFPQEQYVHEHGFAATANMFARREVFEKIGAFDAGLRSGGDVDFGIRAMGAGFRLAFRSDVVVRHPARRSVREHARRLKRTMSGRRDIAVRSGLPYPFPMSTIIRDLVPPLPTVARTLVDSAVCSVIDRLKLAYRTVLIHYARTYLKLTVRFDSHSPRA